MPESKQKEYVEKEESELAIFWEEMSKNLPKSVERSALGDEKIFVAFKCVYPKIKEYLLSQYKSSLRERIENTRPRQYARNTDEEGKTIQSDYNKGFLESRAISLQIINEDK